MKTLSILMFTALMSTGAFAQQFVNQKDPFTGKQVKGATITFGNALKNIGQTLAFAESDGKKVLMLTWMPSTSGASVDGINFDNFNLQQCSILVLMSDGNLIKFKADPTLSKKTGSGQMALLAIGAVIVNDQLKVLSSQDIKTIRLGLTNENSGIDIPYINDKTRNQIKKAAEYLVDIN